MKRKHAATFIITVTVLSAVVAAVIIKGNITKTNSETHLKEITVQNWDEEDHNVTIIVEKNEDIVYWQNLYLKETFRNGNNISTFDHESIPEAVLGGQIEDYAIFARITETGEGERYEFTSQSVLEVRDSCEQNEYLEISITIREADSIRDSVTCEKQTKEET